MAYPPAKKKKCLALANEGMPLIEISESEDIPYRTLQRWIKTKQEKEHKQIVQEATYNLNSKKLPQIEYNAEAKRWLDKALENYNFFDYQKKWLTDFSQFRIVFKSRQIGFTWIESLSKLIEAKGGMTQNITSASEKQAYVWSHYIKKWGQILGIKIEGSAMRLDVDGTLINIMANNPRTNQSFAGSVDIDEAGWIAKLELLYSVMLPMIGVEKTHDGMRARLSLISTQFDETHFFNKIFENTKDFPHFSRHFVDIYRATRDGLDIDLEIIKNSMSKNAWELFYECKFGDDEYALFSRKLIKNAIDAELCDRELTRDAIIESAYSVHTAKDIETFIALEKQKDKLIFKKLKEFNRATYREKEEYLNKFLRDFVNAKIKIQKREDARELGQNLRKEFKSRVSPINLKVRDQEKLVIDFKRALEEDRLVLPNDPELIREIYSIKKEGKFSNATYIAPSYPVNFWTLAIANSQMQGAKGRAVII